MTKTIGFLYINGLGYGKTTPKDRLVQWWWKRAKLDIYHTHINWYDDRGLEEKLKVVEQHISKMLSSYDSVTIIGSSAGGSLALNSFWNTKNKNICVVNAHGRLAAGSYPKSHRMSLYHRAHLGSSKPSPSFYNSVARAETKVIPNLSAEDKQKILVLTPLTDMVVPIKLMGIAGAQKHRSLAFGHFGAFFAHMLADRDIINRFARNVLG